MKNKYLLNLFKTMGMYACIAITLMALQKLAPGGPCVPGGGLMALLFIVPVIVVLFFLVNVYQFVNGQKNVLLSLIIHGFFLIFILLYILP